MMLRRYDAIGINGYGITPSVSGGITPAGAAGRAVCKARQAMNPEHTEVCEDFIVQTATPHPARPAVPDQNLTPKAI